MSNPIDNNKFFSASEVIGRDEFLRLYRIVSAVSNVLLSPYGFADQLKLVIDEDRIVDEYTAVFQQIEDVVAKVIFRHFGYDDDRIIASMHQYVGVEQDKQLLEEIKSAKQILAPMVERPPVVDFDFTQLQGAEYDHVLFNESTVNTLFDRIRQTLTNLANFTYLSSSNKGTQDFCVGLDQDTILFKAYGVNVLKRLPSPILCLSNLLDVKNMDTVKLLIESLMSVFILKYTATTESEDSTDSKEKDLLLNQEQINVLLDIYWKNTLSEVTGSNNTSTNNPMSLEDIRIGLCLTDIQAFRHPVGQFLLQLSSIMVDNNAANDDNTNNGNTDTNNISNTDKKKLSAQRYRDATESLAFVQQALKKLDEAKSIMSMGDAESAAELLTEGVLDLLDFDLDMDAVLAADVEEKGEEEEGEEEKGGRIVIPVALQTELLLARAKYMLEAGQVDSALVDIQRAIQCDASSSAAYALRAQARLAMIQRGQFSFYSDNEEAENDEKVPDLLLEMVDQDETLITEQDIALHKAAEDAMVGFLLGGSSDINQASLAEELAKETVRSFSRTVFHNRRNNRLKESSANNNDNNHITTGNDTDNTTENSSNTEVQPKPWLIGSYLSSYPLLSESLQIHGTRSVGEALRLKQQNAARSLNIDADTNNVDIDEGEYQKTDSLSLLTCLPPDHLLDATKRDLLLSTTNTAELVNNQKLVQVLEKDVAAYDVLVQLVDQFESFAFGDASAPLPAHLSIDNTNTKAKSTTNKTDYRDLDGNQDEEENENKKNSVLLTCSNAQNIPVHQVGSVQALNHTTTTNTSSDIFVEKTVDHETVLSANGSCRLAHIGVSAFIPLSQSELTECNKTSSANNADNADDKHANNTKQALEQEQMLCDEKRVSDMMKIARRAATWAGVKLEDRRFVVTGFDFDYSTMDYNNTNKNNQSTSNTGNNTYAAKEAEEYYQSASYKNTAYGGMAEEEDDDDYDNEEAFYRAQRAYYGGGDQDDEDEEEDNDGEEYYSKHTDTKSNKRKQPDSTRLEDEDEEQWEDCDDDADEEDDNQAEEDISAQIAANVSVKTEKVTKNVAKDDENPAETQDNNDENDHAEDEEADFARLAAMVAHVDLSRGASLGLPQSDSFPTIEEDLFDAIAAAAGMKEAAVAATINNDTNNSNNANNNTDIDTAENTMAAGGLEVGDVDVSIDDLIDALAPLTMDDDADNADNNTNKNNDNDNNTNVNIMDTIESGISNHLRARLLNVVGSLAYLVGDSVGASQCLQASLHYDNQLQDSRIKLGALFVDLDESQKAFQLLTAASQAQKQSAVALLHLGQWALNESEFSQAAEYLRRAHRLLSLTAPTNNHNNTNTTNSNNTNNNITTNGNSNSAATQYLMAQWVDSVWWQERCAARQAEALSQIHANVFTLLAVATFRQSPTDPEFAVSVVTDGLARYPTASTLLLCGGEILAQAGDMVKGLHYFHLVSQLPAYVCLPLPYISAARVYQQLGQLTFASLHLQRAWQYDQTLAMTLVDQSQLLRQEKQLDAAVRTIDQAMVLAKQVSEIRDVLSTKYLARLQQVLAEKYRLDMSLLQNNAAAH